MIPRTAPLLQRQNWQQALADAIKDPKELLRLLALPETLLQDAYSAAGRFPLRVPHSFVQRINPGDMHDPLLRQILPLGEEIEPQATGFIDPVGDMAAMAVPGVLHKYHGRVLLVTTGACGIHCRYCFRQHFPYPQANAKQAFWQTALDYIANDRSIEEVILSGGDPFSLSDDNLARLISALDKIPQLKRLRIHTRLPVVLPARVTEDLLQILTQTRLQTVLVLHINHAREIDAEVSRMLVQLRQHCDFLFNQAVLLKGVNDSVDSLIELSERLADNQVIPYYLHQLDPVQGAQHFLVAEDTARKLVAQLRAHLPGYLVPRWVQEIPGKDAKLPL